MTRALSQWRRSESQAEILLLWRQLFCINYCGHSPPQEPPATKLRITVQEDVSEHPRYENIRYMSLFTPNLLPLPPPHPPPKSHFLESGWVNIIISFYIQRYNFLKFLSCDLCSPTRCGVLLRFASRKQNRVAASSLQITGSYMKTLSVKIMTHASSNLFSLAKDSSETEAEHQRMWIYASYNKSLSCL